MGHGIAGVPMQVGDAARQVRGQGDRIGRQGQDMAEPEAKVMEQGFLDRRIVFDQDDGNGTAAQNRWTRFQKGRQRRMGCHGITALT